MRKWIAKTVRLWVAVIILYGCMGPSSSPPAASEAGGAPVPGAFIQRTMTLLATSTPARRNRVKILIYGQSISQQDWWKIVADNLRERFPHADLVVENRAIGGFAVPLLNRPAEHDVFPFYPDLILFHVYGSEEPYEQLVREIRSRTTAEIAIQNDHYTDGQRNDWHDRHSFVWLPELCRKYGLEFIDVRTLWVRHLRENNLKASDLLSDGVHLNDRGNELLAELIKPHLVHLTDAPSAGWRDLVREYQVGEDVKWEGNKLALDFDGNRVDLIADPDATAAAGAKATILIDGKPPSAFSELYAITRPSNTVGVDWPAIVRISRGPTSLQVEEWTLRVKEVLADGRQCTFELFGSKTGLDGGGRSDLPFTSNSGRVVIQPEDWYIAQSRDHSGQAMPAGHEIRWSVIPMFADAYMRPEDIDSASEHATTVAQGLENGRHRMEIIAEGGAALFRAIRVYRPPVE